MQNGSTPKPPAGFAPLAGRIARRTTDLLAIGIVAVGLLTVGRQVSEWWSTDPDQLSTFGGPGGLRSTSSNPWGSGAAEVAFDSGGRLYTLNKQFVSGDETQAAHALLAECRRVVETAAAPRQEADAAEQRLLEQLEAETPVEERAGDWKLYRVQGALPFIAGVRWVSPSPLPLSRGERGVEADAVTPSKDATARAGKMPTLRGTDPAAGRWRVVCWGMAFPSEASRWMLYTFHSSRRTDPASDATSPEISLPPGSRRLLSLRAESGDTLVAFAGEGEVEAWKRFFDEWSAGRGWRSVRGWQSAENGWAARFEGSNEFGRGGIDVQFGRSGPGNLSGLLSVTPSSDMK